jgi:hypothetical protein
MDRLGVQSHTAVSLQLLVGRKWINKSFYLSWAFVINLHGLICLRNVSRVILRQRVLCVSVVGKASAVRSPTFVRSVLRMASPWQSVVRGIRDAGVAKSKSPARGRPIATALCHSWAVATAVRHPCTLAAAVPHSSSLAASASASTAAVTAAAAVTTTAVTAAAAVTTTAVTAAAVTTAAGTAAATTAAVATTAAAAAATTAAATTAAAAAATTAAATTAAATTAAATTAAAATTTTTAAATTTTTTAAMGPDWIRQDYRDRERQQEDKAGFHSTSEEWSWRNISSAPDDIASRLKAGFTFFAPSMACPYGDFNGL